MHQFKLLCTLVTSSVLLAACGGGGSGSNNTSNLANPEGAYEGTTSSGTDFTALVLDNGISWATYGARIAGTLYVYGVVSGVNGTYNGSTFTTSVKDYFYTGETYSGTLSASYVPGTSFNGSISYTNGNSGSFNAGAVPLSSFNYNTPANLANAAGTWNGVTSSGASGSISITSGGSLSGTIGGCSLSGQVTPRSSGKNVFDASITFGASPCAYPGVTSSGNAVVYPITGGLTQLVLVGTTPDRSAGTAFLSQR